MRDHLTDEFLKSQGLSERRVDGFFSKIDKDSSPNGCWLWTGFTNKNGYGVLNRDYTKGKGHTLLAHRVSWMVHNGPIPKRKEVCHDCPEKDNPLCVCPDHLWLGTHWENFQDGVRKHQMKGGEEHYNHVLTAADVIEIRRLRAEQGISYYALADRFGANFSTIRDAIKRLTWKRI